jgi:hypothetical protein
MSDAQQKPAPDRDPVEETQRAIAELINECQQLGACVNSHASCLGGIEKRLLRIEQVLAAGNPARVSQVLAGALRPGWVDEQRRLADAENRVWTDEERESARARRDGALSRARELAQHQGNASNGRAARLAQEES